MRDNFWFSRLAAASLLVVGALGPTSCDKKKADDSVNVPTPTKEIVATGPLEQLVTPAGVVAFGGAESPEALVSAFAGAMGPAGAMFSSAMAASGVEQSLNLPSGTIDFGRPMRVALIDPKSYKEPLLLAFVAKSGREALATALPADKKKDDGGNAYSFSASNKTSYLNFIDEFVVVTSDKDLFAKNREFVKALLGAKAAGQVALVVSMKNVGELFGREMDLVVEQMKGTAPPPGFAGADPAQLATTVQGMMELVRAIDSLTVSATMPEGGLLLTIDGRAKAGTDLARETAAMGAGKLALLPRLPKDAAFAAVFSMDTEKISPLMQQMMQWSMKMAFAGGGEKFAGLSEAFMKACSGEFAYVGYPEPSSDNFNIVSLSGVRDAALLKKGWDDIIDLYRDTTVIEKMSQTGVRIQATPNAYKIGEVPVAVLDTKVDVKGAAKNDPALARMSSVLAMLGSSHFAVSSDLAVVAMGQDPKKAMAAWLDAKVAGGLDQAPGLAKAKARAADNAFMLAWGSVQGLVSALGTKGRKNSVATTSDSGIAISLGSKNGALRLAIDVPADQIQQLIALGGSLKGMH